MKKYNEKVIIERVKLLRNQYAGSRGKSRFARALGISASTYSYYENNRVPPIGILLKICEVTGADLEWLLTGSEIPRKSTFERGKFTFVPDKDMASSTNSLILRKLDALLDENPDLSEPISAFIELLFEKKGVERKFRPKVPGSKPARPLDSGARQNRCGDGPLLGPNGSTDAKTGCYRT